VKIVEFGANLVILLLVSAWAAVNKQYTMGSWTADVLNKIITFQGEHWTAALATSNAKAA